MLKLVSHYLLRQTIFIPVALFQAVMDKSCSRVFCALSLLAVVLLTSTRVQSQSPSESFGEAADCAARIAACSKPTSRSSLLANTTRLPDECMCANEVITQCCTVLIFTCYCTVPVLLLAKFFICIAFAHDNKKQYFLTIIFGCVWVSYKCTTTKVCTQDGAHPVWACSMPNHVLLSIIWIAA